MKKIKKQNRFQLLNILVGVLFLFLFITYSCSPIKRFNRLVEKHPYVLKQDSLKIVDTVKIVTEKVEVDTVFITQPKDTHYIEKENLKLKLIIKDSIIKVKAECKSDTIIRVIERQVPVYIPAEKPKKELKWYQKINWYKILFVLLIVVVVYRVFEKK